jgi:asparagine N-glycosylation enzyme membrane subunit Stt3
MRHEEIQWSMWFYCSFAHPTILFRASSMSSFRYATNDNKDEDDTSSTTVVSCTEDYGLWFRMMARATTIMDTTTTALTSLSSRRTMTFNNLPFSLLRLRKHSSNVSLTRRDQQQKQARYTVLISLLQLLSGSSISTAKDLQNNEQGIATVACLQRPETATCMDSMNHAVQVLLALEDVTLSRIRTTRGTNSTNTKENEDMSFIVQDTTSRMGAMAMTAVQKYGAEGAHLLALWQGRKKNKMK